MSNKLLSAMLLAAGIASAQRAELGGLAGGGAFAVSSGEAAPRGLAGVEACVFCSGRFALVGEYSHWFSGNDTRTAFDRVRTADVAGVGLRIQSRGRARAFFDVGLVAGRDGHTLDRGGAIGGVVVGTGVRIPWGEHWYIRPQFRAYGLSPHTLEGMGVHWAVSGAVGVGYRF
jgi:hypothetical protein